MAYTCFTYVVKNAVAHIQMKRGEALNTMNEAFWQELPALFSIIEDDPQIRCVVLSSSGKHFSAGLDFQFARQLLSEKPGDPARQREYLRRQIRTLQEAFTVIARARVPVIAAIQGGCIGAGVDLVAACDIRLGSAESYFTIQEIGLGIVADLGTLQRMPRLIPEGLVRELAYTGRRWEAAEAREQGFLNHLCETPEITVEKAFALANEIAARSPVAITGIKQVMNAAQDQSIEQGLDYVATWNAAMLLGEDVKAALKAQMERQEAKFADLIR